MVMVKKMVLSAIEQTNGVSPRDMLEKIREVESSKETMIFAKDYMASIDALRKKGYSTRSAARVIVAMGCPFAEGTLTQCWWQRRKVS